MKDFRPRLKGKVLKAYENLTKVENRVLVIGDLHEPFCLDGYLKFCKEQYAIHNCNKVVFIGDVIDNHYSSYHESSADGLGGKFELEQAVKKLSKWYRAFPDADVTLGNHDRIIIRKAQSSNIPSKWIKEFKEVLVSGHFHTDFYCEWMFGKTRAIFGMSVGCGIDSKSYAMAYMQGGKKEAIGLGVVIGGHTAFNVKMEL